MLTEITFKFTIGKYNGSMGMAIFSDGRQIFRQDYFDNNEFVFTTEISWPGTVTIEVFNKQIRDTEIDSQGNITNDKYIKLNELIIDKILVDEEILKDFVILDTGTKILKERYWGFNGKVTLTFTESEFFLWFLTQRSKKYNIGCAPSSTSLLVAQLNG
jgi:hypothetical protein